MKNAQKCGYINTGCIGHGNNLLGSDYFQYDLLQQITKGLSVPRSLIFAIRVLIEERKGLHDINQKPA